MTRNGWNGLVLLGLAIAASPAAQAEFIISSAIVEFAPGGPRQQDIELVSRGQATDYIESEVSLVLNPGTPNETRQTVTDPEEGGLLVTPDKTVLAAGARKLLRFVLLKEAGGEERIYRVAIKPVIKGVEHQNKVGLKVLVGYEALVIVRPASIRSGHEATRSGKTLTIRNSGNSNVLFQNGEQCPDTQGCKLPPAVRVYSGQSVTVELPLDKPVTYSVWDGLTTTEKTIH